MGRGGGGFMTGRKWKITLNTAGDEKYLACNTDESSLESFIDRTIIEGDPHRLIEGIANASYAIGANNAFIYIRSDYFKSFEILEEAIRQAKEFDPIKKWWKQRIESDICWKVDIKTIIERGYDLDIKNPIKQEEEILYTSNELITMLTASMQKSNELINKKGKTHVFPSKIRNKFIQFISVSSYNLLCIRPSLTSLYCHLL